ADGFDLAEGIRRVRAEPERDIATALLDQRTLSGIGNEYKNEVLFLTSVWPWTKVRDLDDRTLETILETARDLMRRNRDGGGRRRDVPPAAVLALTELPLVPLVPLVLRLEGEGRAVDHDVVDEDRLGRAAEERARVGDELDAGDGVRPVSRQREGPGVVERSAGQVARVDEARRREQVAGVAPEVRRAAGVARRRPEVDVDGRPVDIDHKARRTAAAAAGGEQVVRRQVLVVVQRRPRGDREVDAAEHH